MSSPSDWRIAASRASRAAVDALFANTNARMLKTKPAKEARFPQFRAKKSAICHWKDYGTLAQRFVHLIAISLALNSICAPSSRIGDLLVTPDAAHHGFGDS